MIGVRQEQIQAVAVINFENGEVDNKELEVYKGAV